MEYAAALDLTRQLMAALPDQIGHALGGVDVRVVRDERELAKGAGDLTVMPGVRGMFVGQQARTADLPEDLDDEDDDDEREPPRGFVFLIARNLQSAEDLATTLYHEIGHALGLDEAEVAALGLSDPQRMTEGTW